MSTLDRVAGVALLMRDYLPLVGRFALDLVQCVGEIAAFVAELIGGSSEGNEESW